MRQFKFRAWDSVKKVFPFVGFNIVGEVTTFDLLKQYKLENFNDLVISQYTGLQDKNDKEIYEGDIVLINEWNHFIENYEFFKGVICFQNGCFITKHIKNYNQEQCGGSSMPQQEDMEVIGNIFENEELLK